MKRGEERKKKENKEREELPHDRTTMMKCEFTLVYIKYIICMIK